MSKLKSKHHFNNKRSLSMDHFPLTGNTDSCFDEMAILKNINEIYKFSFSNNLDDIKLAIFSRTGHEINLNEAYWRLVPHLNISIKHLMSSHNVNYSMTIDDDNSVIIYMHTKDNWLITGYDKIDDKYLNWETLEKIYLLQKFDDYLLSDEFL
jgi:hypothetical protein